MISPADTNEWRWCPVWQQTNIEDPESRELFTGTIEYAVFREGTPAGPYTPAVMKEGYPGIRIDNLTPGTYRVRARVTGIPGEAPTIDCGTFTLKA